jgi:hypothetical protein
VRIWGFLVRNTLTIILGLRAAVIAGLISAGTAEGIIQRMIEEMK